MEEAKPKWKWCRRCLHVLPLAKFGTSKGRPRAWCRRCNHDTSHLARMCKRDRRQANSSDQSG